MSGLNGIWSRGTMSLDALVDMYQIFDPLTEGSAAIKQRASWQDSSISIERPYLRHPPKAHFSVSVADLIRYCTDVQPISTFYPSTHHISCGDWFFWVKTCASGLLCWTSLCQRKSSLLRCPTLLFSRKRWCAMPVFAWVIHGKWGEVCTVNICSFFACLSEYILDIPNFWVLTLTWGSVTVWML